MSRITKLALEQTIMDQAAKRMSDEIDREVIWSMLETIGWVRVSVSRLVDNQHAIDMVEWISANCISDHKRNGREFLFEAEEDAIMFALRWK